ILEAAIAYANSKEHQLDGLVDILREARIAAEEAGRTSIRAPDIKRAMTEVIEPSLVAKQWNGGRPRRESPPDAAVGEPLQRSCEPGAGPAQPLCGAGRRESFLEVSVGEG
ncbi:MAG: hypothetical protein JNK85_25435, partial [Verrucomicrobiales bacterium]|nr:hypothetical protein [Verrucomicrobiales bacterium]